MDMAYEDHGRTYDCLLFDVDDTLYPLSSGLSKACTKNVEEYMVQKLGIEENEVSEMNQVLYKNYGTSMAGLKAVGYDFDNDDYHSYVHGRLHYENLKTDYVLRSFLLSLPIQKIIFSNADEIHVGKVIRKLGLEGCFDGIICFENLNPNKKNNTNSNPNPNPNSLLVKTPIVCKPFEEAFEKAFKLATINPQKTIFFDDSIRNIETGKRMGLKTVLVGAPDQKNGADHALGSIHNIREALPELWEANGKAESRKYKAPKIGIVKA